MFTYSIKFSDNYQRLEDRMLVTGSLRRALRRKYSSQRDDTGLIESYVDHAMSVILFKCTSNIRANCFIDVIEDRGTVIIKYNHISFAHGKVYHREAESLNAIGYKEAIDNDVMHLNGFEEFEIRLDEEVKRLVVSVKEMIEIAVKRAVEWFKTNGVESTEKELDKTFVFDLDLLDFYDGWELPPLSCAVPEPDWSN